MVARGYLQDCTDLEGLDARLIAGTGHRLRRLRRHRAVAARRAPAQHHDAALAAEDRPPADHADGRRHHQGRRPVVPLRGAAAADARGDRARTSRPSAGSSASTSTTGPSGALMLDNAEWLDGLNYLDVPARHRPALLGQPDAVVREREVAARPRPVALSFLEFNYMILQAYDFLELYRREGCVLQMGGSDQWGNIVNGIDLTRRVAGAEVFGLTSPLLDHRRRRQDGQDRRRRGLAERRGAGALRLLAVLAQHRRRRRRAVPEALHRAAGRGVRPARRPRRCRRSTRRRSSLANEVTTLCHGAGRGGRGRGDGARGLRARRRRRRPADADAGAGRDPRGRHPGRAAAGARRARRLRQGRAAADRRGRRPARRRGADRRRPAPRRRGARAAAQALGGPQAPRAGAAASRSPPTFPEPMLGAIGAALLAVPDAVGLGIEAMGFSADAFRRVAAGADRDLVLLVVYLAGMSLGDRQRRRAVPQPRAAGCASCSAWR